MISSPAASSRFVMSDTAPDRRLLTTWNFRSAGPEYDGVSVCTSLTKKMELYVSPWPDFFRRDV